MIFCAAQIHSRTHWLDGFGNDMLSVNDRYITKDGKPWIPVMGEMHYSRVPEQDWETELQKMKDGGITVVASYVFWIHHEEREGCFRWDNNLNLRKFIKLCDKLGLYFFLRIGPWAHGECRNGGFPDWLQEKCYGCLRGEYEPYLSYVRGYIEKVAGQVKDLPNIIGIQVENELVHEPQHLLHIKKMVLESGLNAPLYTATAWGRGASIPMEELLPIYGGYPEAPWEPHTGQLSPSVHYFYKHERDDNNIGKDMLGIAKGLDSGHSGKNLYTTPFMTCEIGGGVQNTYHRRPVIAAEDVYCISANMLGSGCNLLGYYMYHGGVNPVSEITTMQESKDSNYPNDYPVISYDFSAPLGDCGQVRQSYAKLSLLHQFVNTYGELLAPMASILPEQLPHSVFDNDTVRCAVRTDGISGFLFVNNYQRLTQLPEHTDVNFTIILPGDSVRIPVSRIPSGCNFIFPFQLKLGDILLRYALAQPVGIDRNVYSFVKIPGIEPLFCFADGRVVCIEDNYQIGSITIQVFEQSAWQPTKGQLLTAHPVEATVPFDQFDYLHLPDITKEWRVVLPEGTARLKVQCTGNVAHAYCNGRLIADYFCNGTPWVIGTHNLEKQELILKIQQLTAKDDIYFENNMPLGCEILKIEAFQEQTIYI